jgi:hypothetical protein
MLIVDQGRLSTRCRHRAGPEAGVDRPFGHANRALNRGIERDFVRNAAPRANTP